MAEGVVDDISHEGLRVLLRQQGVSFQRVKTWKASKDPYYAAKKARVEHLYAIADREVVPDSGEPDVDLLRGRVRAAEPAAPARTALGRGQREAQGTEPGAAAADARHLYPHRGGPAPVPDVAIYLLSLAEMTSVDLQNQIESKMAKNATRVYRPLPTGTLAKIPTEADEEA